MVVANCLRISDLTGVLLMPPIDCQLSSLGFIPGPNSNRKDLKWSSMAVPKIFRLPLTTASDIKRSISDCGGVLSTIICLVTTTCPFVKSSTTSFKVYWPFNPEVSQLKRTSDWRAVPLRIKTCQLVGLAPIPTSSW